MMMLKRLARRRWLALGLILTAVTVAYLALLSPARALPVLQPTYSIDAVSGSHHASLLNLPVGQPGTVLAPEPVDIDGDLVPDVAVAVNLENVNGVFNNPPQIGAVIAPNIQIDRLVTAPVLGQKSPPLKIQVVLTVKDTAGGPDTVLKFGYDTGQGGSIPTYYRALVGGLSTFFNPLQAVVDTTGTVVGLQPNVNGLGLAPVSPPYQGPLHVIGGVTQGTSAADLDFGFKPFPYAATVGYGTDTAGKHISYAHAYNGQVDLDAAVKLANADSTTSLNARVDRLPKSLTLDLADRATNSGAVDFTASQNGRLPDVAVDVATTKPDARPLFAHLSIDDLPAILHGDWSLPEGGPAHAAFCAPAAPTKTPCTGPQGAGIGAVQAQVTNYDPTASPPATTLTPYVPDQRQFLNFQQGGSNPSDPDRVITGRVERVRQLVFTQTGNDGFDVVAQVGDDELPLVAHFLDDGRGGTAPGPYTESTATVAPLPGNAHIAFAVPPAGSGDPTVLTYNASEPVDVEGTVTRFDADSGGACGTHNTICGDVKAKHIPSQIVTTIVNQAPDTNVTVVSTNGGAIAEDRPDFFVDATLGQPHDRDHLVIDDTHPLVAHAELLGFPRAISILAHQGANQTLDRLEYHACDLDFATGACKPPPRGETDNPIGLLAVNVHNWLTRPANLPPPPPPPAGTSDYASVTARGVNDPDVVLFEAAAQMTAINEVDYRNTHGIFGLHTDIGSALKPSPLTARVDLNDVAFDPTDPTSNRTDVTGDATIDPLPQTLDVCFRQPHHKIASTGSPFTALCEDANPFGDATPLDRSPTSFAFNGKTGFDVTASARYVDRGPNEVAMDDDQVIQGEADIKNVPHQIAVDVESPKHANKGPTRAVYRTDPNLRSPNDPQMSVDFAVSATDADLICQDPRPPLLFIPGSQAICLKGHIANLPTNANFFFDPTDSTDNFSVTTSGDRQMDLTGFKGDPDGIEASWVDLKANQPQPADETVMIARGTITGIPKSLSGTLYAPKHKAPTVDLIADPPVGHVDATIRNFIAPNPIINPVPDRTVTFGDPAQIVTPAETATFRQVGDAFEAHADITDVKRVGYRTVADADGKPLDTSQINVEFGHNQVVRAYADLAPDQNSHTIADVTLNDVPAGLLMCIRPQNTHKGTAPGAGQATYCDRGDATIPVSDDDGAIQFQGTPDETSAGKKLDVDAFIRQATGGGSDVIAGRVHVEDIPFFVEGTFPTGADKGNLDIGGFQSDGVTPDGIGSIDANVSSFDLEKDDTGYGDDAPFERRSRTHAPFPVEPSQGRPYVKAVLTDDDFQVRGHIGPSSQLQRVQMEHKPCDAPEWKPADYPYYTPSGPGVTYTCIGGAFVPSGASEPFDVEFTSQKGDDVFSLTDAGLTALPAHLQMTLADAAALALNSDDAHTLRSRCGAAKDTPQGTICAPPVLRFDNDSDVKVFGRIRVGREDDLAVADETVPSPLTPLADLSASPNPNGSPAWPAAEDGVRAKVVLVGPAANPRPALDVALRLPVPHSLTVDQPQSWSESHAEDKARYWDASDLRFHYVIRNEDGSPYVGTLGKLSAMVKLVDGTTVLVSNPCPVVPRDRTSLDACDADFTQGIPITGEFGVDLFLRNNMGTGRDFIQIDGHSGDPGAGQSVNLGARLFGMPDEAIGPVEAEVDNLPTTRGYDAADINPTFRVRMEILGQGAEPPTDDTADDEPEQDATDCTFDVTICAQAAANISSIYGQLDFQQARQIDVVVNQTGAANGLEVQGWDAVDRGGLGFDGFAVDASSPTPTHGNPARVKANAYIDIEPLEVYLSGGLSVLAHLDMALSVDIHAHVAIDSSDFVLKQNLVRVQASSGDYGLAPYGDSTVEFNPVINLFHAQASSLFVPLLWMDHPAGIVLSTGVHECPGFPIAPEAYNQLTINPGAANVDRVFWPFDDGLLSVSGPFAPGFQLAAPLAQQFFCFADVDGIELATPTPSYDLQPSTLHSGSDLVAGENHPGDPIGSAVTGHIVPTAPDDSQTEPAPAPPPNPTLNPPDLVVHAGETRIMCGAHTYNHVDVYGTITTPETAGFQSPDCPYDPNDPYYGTKLLLSAAQIHVWPKGEIKSDNVATYGESIGTDTIYNSQHSGNGGGGHGGDGGRGGGNGGSGNGGYGDADTSSVTESGMNSGYLGGGGGGAILLEADDVILDAGSSVHANGGNGEDIPKDCGTPYSGGGGGSGGGILISALKLVDHASIAAYGGNGGNGAASGGGGGGGGRVKIFAAVSEPADAGDLQDAIDVHGGTGGSAYGCDGGSDGGGGGGGENLVQIAPRAIATVPLTTDKSDNPVYKFWRSSINLTDLLTIPYKASRKNADTEGATIYLCARYSTTDQVAAAGDVSVSSLFPKANFTQPDASQGAPCGTDTNDPPTFLGPITSPDIRQTADERFYGSFIAPSLLPSGYHGLWAVEDGDRETHGAGEQGEVFPAQAEIIVGIDNTPPTVSIDSPHDGFVRRSHTIELDISGSDQEDLSGFSRVRCKNENQVHFHKCKVGGNSWSLSDGDGPKTVTVRAFDKAGNFSDTTVTGLLDTTVPTSSATVSGGTQQNSWYQALPTVTITGSDESGGSGLADPPIAYRIDEGDEHTCDNPCTLGPNKLGPLTTGDHQVHYTAVDDAKNRLKDDEMNSVDLKVDAAPPQSALLSVPAGPDLGTGWFTTRPYVVLSALDQPSASGVAAISYTLDNDPTVQTYSGGPFRLANGEHDVCWYATDGAGNVEDHATGHCRHFKVDALDPSVFVDASPSMPDGGSGWYLSSPSVTVKSADAGPSGVASTFVSIDGAPFTTYSGGITIPEGVHDVRAYAVDVAGNVGLVVRLPVKVDLSPPVSSAIVIPGAPAQNGWWRRGPQVMLRAVDGDQNSGVAVLKYRLDGGAWVNYGGPVSVPEGKHTVDWQAIDAAGLGNRVQSMTLPVDVTPPVVGATSPSPSLWLRTPGSQAQLGWTVSDNLSHSVHITVLVFNAGGAVVRQLDGGTHEVQPGTTLTGSTAWDGKDQTITGLVPIGLYYYRVVAIDVAGITAQSGDSRPLQITL